MSNIVAQVAALQTSGRFMEAERLCRSSLVQFSTSAALWDQLGVALMRLSGLAESIKAFENAVRLEAENHIYHTNLGSAFASAERYDEATVCFRRALGLKSSVPELHYNLANALKDSGKFEEAISSYQKALQLRSSYPAAWSNLGATYIKLGNLDSGEHAIKRAIALNPQLASAYGNLASVELYRGNLKACIENCGRALTINPALVDAYRTYGTAMLASLNFPEALAAFNKLVTLRPDDVLGRYELANAQINAGDFDGVAMTLRSILVIDPADAKAWCMLAITESQRGYEAASNEAFSQAAALDQTSLSLRIRRAQLIPPVAESTAQIAEVRRRIASDFDELHEQNGMVEDPQNEQLTPNFFLAFHALNNRDLQIKIASVYRKLCPTLTYVADHCTIGRPGGRRLRVGFFSRFIWNHSVSVAFGDVVHALAERGDLDVLLVSTVDTEAIGDQSTFKGFKGGIARVPMHLQYAQRAIDALELDVLIYLDIGMDPFSHLLAFSRLARVQAVVGGHPDTTGIDTIDYFLSSSAVEPADADSHYSEKLIRMPSGGFSFARPTTLPSEKSRGDLGLPLDGAIYLCPMMLQKLHPDFDQAVDMILRLDVGGCVVFFESPQHTRWTTLLKERLDRNLNPEVRSRAIFIPWINDRADFMRTIELSDVILDPFHFGIGTTGAFTTFVGTPIVSWPGEFLRGRGGLLLCNLLGTPECIAPSHNSYPALAVRIARDSAFNRSLRDRILRNGSNLFGGPQPAANDIAEFVVQVAGTSLTPMPAQG